MAKLSIIIPARNEMFLAKTIENILENIEGDTEVIAVLDGEWADPAVSQHERVTIVYHPESIGQRAATNEAAKVSKAKYLMKVDAHCSFDKGFDAKMMKDMQDDWTFVPVMKNLHAFDWVCKKCKSRKYQGRTPTECMNKECDSKEFERDMVWQGKPSPNSTSFRFNREMRFKYWGGYKKLQKGDLVETLSLQGSCFMVTRDKYWEIGLCDEKHGGWGQQGTEVACKTWLSGGRVMVNKKTWYAHMFRTQGGDFGFPYSIRGSEQRKAREYSKGLFLEGKWEGAKYPLSWLLEKFWPVPDWEQKDLDELKRKEKERKPKPDPKKGIIFYTDNQLNIKIARAVQKQLKSIGLPIASASLKPMPNFGKNIHVPLKRGVLTMFKQILAALEASDADIVFFCEADVLYHPSHFEFTPPKKDVFYYNVNLWKVRSNDGHAVRVDDCKQVSGISVYRKTAIKHYRKRVEMVEKDGFNMKMGYEPGTHGRPERVDDYKAESWESKLPNIDIRHDSNFSPTRWKKEQFRNQRYTKGWTEADEVSGWGVTKNKFDELLKKIPR